MSLVTLLLALLAVAIPIASTLTTALKVHANDWFVVAVGSSDYSNYRHQADGLHAANLALNWGIPRERLIVMMYDDIAASPQNPYPGQVFNHPSPLGSMPTNLYSSDLIDYRGENVTADHFMGVLTGNTTLAGSDRVLQSTADDHVFIVFVDHGAPGIVCMPDRYLHNTELMDAFRTMHSQQMYSKLVFYLEACESGSMFEEFNAELIDMNIYATTASNGQESSWGSFCGFGSVDAEDIGVKDDSVNGVSLHTCLADLYMYNWLSNAAEAGPFELMEVQYEVVKNLTDKSEVCQFGQPSVQNDTIGEYEGQEDDSEGSPNSQLDLRAQVQLALGKADTSARDSIKADSRTIALNITQYHDTDRAYQQHYDQLWLQRVMFLDVVTMVRAAIEPLSTLCALKQQLPSELSFRKHLLNELMTAPLPDSVACLPNTCCAAAIQAIDTYFGGYTDYSLKYHRVILQLCSQPEVTSSLMVHAIRETSSCHQAFDPLACNGHGQCLTVSCGMLPDCEPIEPRAVVRSTPQLLTPRLAPNQPLTAIA